MSIIKKFILVLVIFTCIINVRAQIGVVTLDKGSDYVPMNMWYTIHEKHRKNQMYFTSHDAEVTGEVLHKVLFDLDIELEDTIGRDADGSLFWGAELGNGFYSWIFYTEEPGYYTVAILTEEQ